MVETQQTGELLAGLKTVFNLGPVVPMDYFSCELH